MTAPERICIHIDGYEEHAQYDPCWHMPHGEEYEVDYILHTRAALAASPLVQEIVAEAVRQAIDMYVRAEDAGGCGQTAVAMWLRDIPAAIRARGEG